MGSKGSKNKGNTQAVLTEKDYKFLTAQTSLSKEEIKQILDKFNKNNPDGNLDRAEFVRLYQTLRSESPELLDEISQSVFAAFDKDRNSSISFSEFLTAYALTSRGDLRKKLEYAFQLYDTDNNGTLNNAEVSAVVGGMLDMLGAEKKNLDMTKLIAECVHGLDKSKDGKIDKNEFINGLLANYHLRMLMSPFN